MKRRTTITLMLALLALLMLGTTAQAEIIFQEYFSDVEDLVIEKGVPTTRLVESDYVPGLYEQVADNDWYGARLGNAYDPLNITNDLWVSWQTTTMPNPTATIRNNSAILIPISTAGYQNVQLTFSYGIYDFYNNLRLKKLNGLYAGYFLGDITGFDADRTMDARDKTDPYFNKNWEWVVKKEKIVNSKNPIDITVDLLDDTDVMWLGFWGRAKDLQIKFNVSNITVTGDLIQPLAPQPVPEPSTVLLLCIGGIGVFLAARKRS